MSEIRVIPNVFFYKLCELKSFYEHNKIEGDQHQGTERTG